MISLKEFWDSPKLSCILCRTEQEAIALCNAFHEMGKTWRSGNSYKNAHWCSHCDEGTWYFNDRTYTENDNWFNNHKDEYVLYDFSDISDFSILVKFLEVLNVQEG